MLATTLAFLSAIALVRADPSYFIYPPTAGQASSFAGNIQVQRGSTIDINWYSNISSYTITLWQQAPTNDAATNWGTVYQTQNGLGTQYFNWTVDIFGSNLTYSPVYFLWLTAEQAQTITTHYFNITAAAKAVSSSSVSSSATSTSPTSTSSTAAATSTAANNGSSSSSATAIGLGVGLGLGIPLILLIAAFFGFRAWRNKRAASKSAAAGGDFYGHDTKGYTAAPQYDQYDQNHVYAMHGASDIHEAPTQTHTGPVEVPGETTIAEASAETAPVELPGHNVTTKSKQIPRDTTA